MWKLLALTLLLSSCHPFFMFKPQTIKDEIATSSSKIHVAVDEYGIPFIKADEINDAIYALGFMHARDRLFQIDLVRHAALGRISEIFGEKTLDYDHKFRILTYRLDEQLDHLSEQERELISHYVKGVNASAKLRGRTAEHFLLGFDFQELTIRDVIAIARLQSWQLAGDLFSEISRLTIARSNLTDRAKAALISSVDDRGSAIIKTTDAKSYADAILPSYLTRTQATLNLPEENEEQPIVSFTGGASNAWVVSGKISSDGKAMLMNDPHLPHSWPSNFYLATIDTPSLFATGATFVGLPGILIGASRDIAWGATAALLNTQDVVLLQVGKDNTYVVDGKSRHFEEWPQQFCINKKAKCRDEMHYLSIFGPVIDKRFDKSIDENDRFAVQWTGFAVEEHKGFGGGFIDLAQTKSVQEGINAVRNITLPGVNLVLADTNGDVGYAYAGLVPKRDAAQNPHLPLDGRITNSKWSGFVDKLAKPAIDNPTEGFIVTANQNIFAKSAAPEVSFGKQGGPPYRALRITERIADMIKADRLLDFDALSSIQLDDTSKEAVELAPKIGAICEKEFATSNASRKEFARLIANFDGRYTTQSRAALPYEMLMQKIINGHQHIMFETVLTDGQTRYALKQALLMELQGQRTKVFPRHFENNDNKLVGQFCEAGYLALVNKAGRRAWGWRWGRHHYLKRQSIIAKAPVVGGFFKDVRREVAGVASAPLAESGTPVAYGANLRFRAKLSQPPQIYAVLDSGNSGTIGDKNAFDQATLWHEGKSIPLITDWDQAVKSKVAHFELSR